MNLSQLQAELRHFAAERDWQPFHTPKNLSTALMVEAAELAEIFQWMTPEASQAAHRDPATKQRIGEEVSDVLLYLLQVADHSQIDIAQAVRDKLVRNAVKYPATRAVAKSAPAHASVPGTQVLLDYENVQPTEDELRAMVPDVCQVWVFHGPHQRQIAKRFASFGAGVTAVPISRTGKNSLDFHLSFYTGYIASRNPASAIVVVANDKGYEPMLEHAKALGFAVRRLGHGKETPGAAVKASPAAKTGAAAEPPAKKVAAKKRVAKQAAAKTPAAKPAAAKTTASAKRTSPAKKLVIKSTNVPAAKKGTNAGTVGRSTGPVAPPTASLLAGPSAVSADVVMKITDNLQKMRDQRPGKAASLRRHLKSFLGVGTADDAVEIALGKLIAAGVVTVGAERDVSYPGFN